MLKRFSFLMSAAMVCFAGHVTAQSQPCSTDEHHRQLMKAHPELEEYERQFTEQLGRGLAARTTASVDTQYYDIPLVVHVVHDYGTENLSDNDIYEAAANWALSFVMANPDTSMVIAPFKPYIGNARMRLHLATIDPQGNPTKGVVRHHSYLTVAGSDQSKIEPWPNNKYINIYFTSTLGNSGAAAYAYYPSSGALMPHYDGVISLASYLNTSKTIPHELGHVLNLPHVWGNNNNAAVACGDDGVDDTPPTRGHTPGCVPIAIYDTTCATGYAKTYMSSTGLVDSVVNYPDTTNAQNIMDYTYCSNMFSIGQCVRMRTALTSSVAGRNNLITPDNVAATGALAPMPDLPPVADFTLNKAVGNGVISDPKSYFLTFNNMGSFSFRNASWNDTISSVNWTFSNGATVPTSTATANVTNRFSIPGWVTVTMTATSNAGSNTIINDRAVYAADTTTIGGVGYSQNFANPADLYNWPMFNYYNNQFKWEHYTGAGKDDNSCLRFRSYDTTNRRSGTANGDYDDVITPAFDLEGVTGELYLNFFTTGASTSNGLSGFGVTRVNDSLEISVSTSGGARWTKIGGVRRTEVANAGNLSARYLPSASSVWKGRSISIPTAQRSSETFFRIRVRAGNAGNNIYLDNLSIGTTTTDVQDMIAAAGSGGLVIYPNPSASGANLMFTSGNDGMVYYSIRDVAGRLIKEVSKNVSPNTKIIEFVDRTLMPSAGLYFVTLTTGGMNVTQKMTVN